MKVAVRMKMTPTTKMIPKNHHKISYSQSCDHRHMWPALKATVVVVRKMITTTTTMIIIMIVTLSTTALPIIILRAEVMKITTMKTIIENSYNISYGR